MLTEQCHKALPRFFVILHDGCADRSAGPGPKEHPREELFGEKVNRKIRADHLAVAAGKRLPLQLVVEPGPILPVDIHERLRLGKKLLRPDTVMLHILSGAVENIPAGGLISDDGGAFQGCRAGDLQKMQKYLVL